MSKAVKTVIGVVAAVAIPFAAPAIASYIGLSTAIGTAVGSATAGSVLGGAVVGATLGAANAAVQGGNVGRGALMGGLGGGVGGYGYTPASSMSQSATTAANASSDPIAALNASQSWTTADPTYLASTTAVADPSAVMNAQQPLGQVAQTPAAGLDTSGLSGAMGNAPTAQLPSAAGGGAPQTFGNVLGKIPEAITTKFKDPKALADLTLRAAGQLAGSVFAGDGLSDEERALLAAQTEELRTLQQTNAGLFEQRLEQAQNLIGESKYFDPEYFGLQSARRAQTQGAIAKRAGLRGLTGERRAAAGRRYDIETGRRTGTAYDTGFQSAVQPRLQTQMAGLSAMPLGFPSASAEFANLRSAYDTADRRRGEAERGFGQMYGTILGVPQAQSRG